VAGFREKNPSIFLIGARSYLIIPLELRECEAKHPEKKPSKTFSMHRVPAKSTIRRFKFTSLLLMLKLAIPIIAAPLLIYGWLFHDVAKIQAAVAMLLALPLVALTQWVTSTRARCPLCLTAVLADKSCSKHSNARSMFGSYRLRVAAAILFKNHFRCPYCGEPTVMKVRERRRG